jgi:hypothetical protein
MQETITIRGDATISLINVSDPNNRIVESVRHYKNLIVKNGKNLAAHFLAGDVAVAGITKMRFGIGGATLPTITDTGLQNEQFIATTTNTYYPQSDASYNQAKFSSVMLSTEGNGETYDEMGLFTASGTMFSRLQIGATVKDIAHEIQTDWVISFQ